MKEEKKDFIVNDRRIFAQRDSEDPGEPKAQKAEAKKPEAETKQTAKAPKQDLPLPEVNFMTFVLSLNSSALLHLGLIEDPEVGNVEKNLSFAKQTIDMLAMLQEKTRGNLTPDEENMLKSVLFELRMAYVKVKE